MKIDREFCDALERAEVAGMRCVVRNAQASFPDLRPALREIGGGVAAFAGINSPLSEAVGIGLWQQAGREQAQALTEFYRERRAQPRVRVSPFADSTFVRALIALGYVPLEYENLLSADLETIGAARDPRVTEMRDAREWSAATGSAFLNGAPCDASNMIVGLMICTPPETTALEIRVEGVIAASACMDVQGEFGAFFGGATSPAHRGKGLQRVLIADRAARVLERGARFGRVTTLPGSPSEQNFRSSGFAALYSRTLWAIPQEHVVPS